MLDPGFVFGFANNFGLLAWLALAASLFLPRIRGWVWPATQFLVPALWAVAYVILLVQGMPETEGSFTSIEGVRALFASDSALTAGWLHYLAFDLFVGTWIVRDGLERKLHPLLILPCLPLTFLFGPAGLLLFLILRFALRGRPQPETV